MNPFPPIPFVNVYQSKGRWYAYFRSKETGKIKLSTASRADYLRAASDAEALRDRLRAGSGGAQDPDSFAWLVGRYLASAEYKALSDPTQADYAKTCALLAAELVSPTTGASLPWRAISRAMLKAVRDDFAPQARKANKIQQMASRIYSWGNEAELVPDGLNPAKGLKRLKRKGGEREYIPWSDAELAWAAADAPLHLLTPIYLALYTGQRGEDIAGKAAMTWQQDQGDNLRVRTSKTHELIDMPCHPVLRAHLDRVRRESKVVQLTGPICLNTDGLPWPSLNAMRGQLRRFVANHPRIPDNRGLHGIRYAAAARMEEGGATVAAIEAVLGHRTFKMALKYASRRLRAAEGVAAMKGEA